MVSNLVCFLLLDLDWFGHEYKEEQEEEGEEDDDDNDADDADDDKSSWKRKWEKTRKAETRSHRRQFPYVWFLHRPRFPSSRPSIHPSVISLFHRIDSIFVNNFLEAFWFKRIWIRKRRDNQGKRSVSNNRPLSLSCFYSSSFTSSFPPKQTTIVPTQWTYLR